MVPLSVGKLSKEELEKVGVKETKASGDPVIHIHTPFGSLNSVDTQEIKDLGPTG